MEKVMTLGSLDYGIIFVYLIGTLGLGLYLAWKDKGPEDDFFVAGRSLGWFAVGASLFASNISSEHLIGLSADGFRTGLAVGNYEWGASLILLILGAVFVPFYIGARISTMPEFLEKRFGQGAKFYLSIITIVANVLVRISVALYAGGLVLESLFGLDFWIGVVLLSFITVFYTAAGGLKAVVYTDALQTIVLLIGTIALSWLAINEVGGWQALRSSLDPSFFDMVKPADDSEMPWPGLLIGVPILGIWYWCTDQVIVQRVLGAKNIHQARMGTVFAAFLKILPVFLFVLPGVAGRVLFPEADSKEIFVVLIQNLLPVGVKGLVAAALIAALMSSIDSTLNSTSTLVSLDVYKTLKPNVSGAQLLRFGRLVTVIVMIFGIAWIQVVMRAESLFQYLQQVNAAISPPIAAVFLVGVFWKRANHTGAITTLIGGFIIGVGLILAEPFPFLISAGVNFGLSLLILVTVSLLTQPPDPKKISGLTWGDARSIVEKEVSVKQRKLYGVLAVIILITMVALWIGFS